MMTAINETQEHKTVGTSEYYKQLQIPSLELGLPVNMPVLSGSSVCRERGSYAVYQRA